jgi:hypothetical protein
VLAAAAPAAAVELSFTPTSATVTGAAPGARVVFLSVGWERVGFVANRFRWQRVAVDEDGDGAVTVDFGRTIPLSTVWAAVDLETGQWTSRTPAAGSFGLVAPQEVVGRFPDRVTVAWDEVELIQVRPGPGTQSGVWGRYARDGKVDDADLEANGVTTVLLFGLWAIQDNPSTPPGELVPGDLLVVVHPETLELYVEQII